MFCKLLISILSFFLTAIPFSVKAQKNNVLHSQQLIQENRIDSDLHVLKNEIKNENKKNDKGQLLLKQGNAYKLNQEYVKALDSYRKALMIFKDEKLLQEEFYTYTLFAELYRYVRQYEKSENYLNLCEKILKNNIIKDDYLVNYYNRKAALLFGYKMNKDSALIYSEKSLELSEKIKDNESALGSMMEIAVIYEHKKKYLKAIRLLNIIIVETKQNSNKQLQADAMINLCRNYDLIKDYNNSIKVALEGFHFSEKHKLSYNQLRFADHLQYMYAQTNDYEKAHKFLTIRLNLTEDYYHKLYNEKFLEYEEKFQMNEKQKIINQKEKILKQKDDELARQNLIKYVILIGLTIVLIFLIILIYYIRIIKNKNMELTFISDQNEFLVAETHHRINNNLQLITILVENELDKVLVTDEVSKKNILVKIDSLQLLHRQLYRNKDKKDLNLKDFLQDIRKNMGILMYDNNVDVHFEIEELVIPINQAMYIGLLVTELCINSLKHAFNGQSDKKIKLVITKIDGKIIFNYSDNSKKTDELPKLVLVDKLCRQLRVDYRAELKDGFKFKFVL